MRRFNLFPIALVASSALILGTGPALRAGDADNRIEAAAKGSYNFKTYLKDDAIKVQSRDGVVTLSGTVARDYHKFLAEETVAGLPGVQRVDNQLTLVGEQPSDKSDGWISTKVMAALTFHKHVSATSTEVHTKDGVVTLTGKADTAAQKELTGEYAKDVEGVKEVRNELTVTHPAKKPAHETFGEKVDDVSITAQLRTALLFRKSTHVLATKIKTRDAVVTLHGEARTAAERDLVTKIAEDIKGVRQVHNRMTVRKN